METVKFKKLDYFFMPKNGGLVFWAKEAKKELILPSGVSFESLRGEDIPFAVAELTRQGKVAAGITGDDLYDEMRYREPEFFSKVELANTTDWIDEKALFGRPVLALLAKKGEKSFPVSKVPTVGVPDKYKETSRRFLEKFFEEKRLKKPNLRILKGSVERGISLGFYPFAVDIVFSGSSMRENGLEIVKVIRASDIATIASKGISERVY